MSAPGQQRRAATDQREDDHPQTVGVDGHRVAYAAFGDPAGEPAVAFHGTPGSRLFGRLYDAPAYEHGVRLLAFDRPGYGASERWPGYDASDTPRVVDAVLADAGVDAAGVLPDAGVDGAGLLAFSGGASHALATAAADPDRFDDVTVVSGAVPPAHVDALPTVQRVLGRLATTTPRLLGGLLRAQAWAAGRADPEFVAAQYTTDGTDHLPADALEDARYDFLEALSDGAAGLVRESAQAVREWPVELGDVTADVRWVHGSEDVNVPVDAARSVTDALPDATLDVVDTDHLGVVADTASELVARHG